MTKSVTMKNKKLRKPTDKKNTERFTISEIIGKRGSTWQITGYKKTGERVRQKHKTREEADGAKHILDLEALGEAKQNLTTLSVAQIKDAMAAFEILGKGGSLVEAATYYKANYKQVSGKPLADAIAAYIDDRETSRVLKTGKKRSERTLYEMKNRLKAFQDFMTEQAIREEIGNAKITNKDAMAELKDAVQPKLVDQISSGDIEAFLSSKGASWNNYRSKLSGFFTWCVKHHICAFNPTAQVERQANEINVEYLSLAEVENLLTAAQSVNEGKFLAYVSIALFAGLRPDSELGKLTWKNIGLKAKKMRVPAGKTGKARAITIADNLCQWLEVCDRTKPIIPEGNFQRGFAAVKRAAGFKGGVRDSKKLREIDDTEGMKPWVPDYTRHTFITHYMGKHGDIYKTATESGNSPEMVRDHYDGLIVDADAIEAYWSMTPKSLRESNLLKFAS
jgi:integrase